MISAHLAQDVPETWPECPLKILTSGIYRKLSGDSQETNIKIDNLIKKLFFRNNSSCITYIFLNFIGTKSTQTFYLGRSTGRLLDPASGLPVDRIMGRSRDVRGTLAKYFV